MDIGSSDQGSNPKGYTSRRAYDLLAEGFGVGLNGPITVGAALENQAQIDAFAIARDQIVGRPWVASVSPLRFNRAQTAATFVVIPAVSPQDPGTGDLIHDLRTDLPARLSGAGVHPLVGGPTVLFVDVGNKIQDRLALFFAAVIGLSFVLLMVVFRSVVIPMTAAILNLLAVGAAYGVLVAVFQWGWLGGILGVERAGPIETFVPMMLFAVLFGLSMDYEVFLVSRIREEWLLRKDNDAAVSAGLTATTRVIAAAAAIMASVFFSFALSDERIIKEFGLGLGFAIAFDALVIRLLIVPATMHLLGRANWWIPTWVGRWLPAISLEHPHPVEEEEIFA